PEYRGVCDALFIGGFSVVAREAWAVLTGVTADGSLSSAG
ncbi:phosphate ABC transporter substrate-binding protein, partial [Enterobacter cloacae]